MPEVFFSNLFRSIKKEWKIAFFSAVVLGFLTHMYVFTNMLPNHDGLINIYSPQEKYTSGRFFLGPISGISSFFDLPWINGSLSILYLALIAIFVIEILEFQKTPAIILTSGIIVTFPTVASTFSYMFTSDGYMGAMLLAVIAVWLTKKFKYGFIPGGLMFYVSEGVYQANLTIVMTIVALWFIKQLSTKETPLKGIFISLLRFIIMTLIGMVLYALHFKIYQKYFGHIVDYQGLNNISFNLELLGETFTQIKDTFFEFLYRGFLTDYPINFFELLNVLLVILIVVGFIVLVWNKKLLQFPIRVLLILVTILLLPILAYALYFISADVSYHMLMVMSLMSIYILPILFYDSLKVSNVSSKSYSWGTVITILLICFNFAIISNISYFNMTLKYERSYAYANRILDRIEQTEGFEEATTLAVFGRPQMDSFLSTDVVPDNIPEMTGALGVSFLNQPYHFTAMFNHQFGTDFKGASVEELNRIKESEWFEEMEVWPAESSVRIVDQMIVVKIK